MPCSGEPAPDPGAGPAAFSRRLASTESWIDPTPDGQISRQPTR